MAAAFVQSIGSSIPADTSSPAITTSATATVGQRIVAIIGYFDNGTTVSSVADSAGNTYAIDLQTGANGMRVAFASAHVTTQLTSGGTITFTLSGSGSWLNLAAMTISGIETSSYTDGTGTYSASSTGGTPYPWDTSDTTTTSADAIIVGAHALRDGIDQSHTAGTNMTEVHETKGGNINFATVYRVLTATGTYDARGEWGATSTLAAQGGHVVYKAAATGPTPPYVSISVS